MDPWIRKNQDSHLQEVTKNGVTYLSFPALEKTGLVDHAFSTRMGGVSEGPYATMNFSFTRGDDPQAVRENYRRMAAALGVDEHRMVLTWQTHTTNVRRAEEADAGKGIFIDRDYRDVDGLVTNVPGLVLVTFFADCVPLYFLDQKKKAIGLSHSGWRGTVNRMGQATLLKMKEEFGTSPKDVLCCIGPSICRDCYEVGEEVIQAFSDEFPKELHSRLFYGRRMESISWISGRRTARCCLRREFRNKYFCYGYLYPLQSQPFVFSSDVSGEERESVRVPRAKGISENLDRFGSALFGKGLALTDSDSLRKTF